MIAVDEIHEEGKRGGGEDRAERDVVREEDDDGEKPEHHADGSGRESDENSKRGGDAFAAFELQPDGVEMAEDGEESGEGGHETGIDAGMVAGTCERTARRRGRRRNPLSASSRRVRMARPLAPVRATLVAPMLPLPVCAHRS